MYARTSGISFSMSAPANRLSKTPYSATTPRWPATWPTNPISAAPPSPGTPLPAPSNPDWHNFCRPRNQVLNLDFGKELQVGGQSIDRRDALRYIGIASVAATFPGFTRWTFACSPDDHLQSIASAPASATPHQPLFLSSEHFRLVEHLSEMIIPADNTPGAKDAGVAEFIDFMLANRVPVNARGDLRSTPDAIRAGEDAQIRLLAGERRSPRAFTGTRLASMKSMNSA